MERELIYLDNNATTPLDPRVLEAMMPYLTHQFANASSTHIFGVASNDAVKKARNQLAALIHAEPHEIIFTSGATEAINMAFKGVAELHGAQKKHIVTVATEHTAVLDVCRYLETKGFEVTYLPVQPDGLVDPDVYRAAIRPDTLLVSVMLVNNETGVIQPISEFAKIARENGALFMTDATQAVGKIPVDVNMLGIDLLALSGHKFHGPKGVGALYVRQTGKRLKLAPILHGGGHERGFRSGTLNVPGIVGLGAASEIAMREMGENALRVGQMRDELESDLLKYPGARINGNREHRIYNTTNIMFPGIDSDALIMALSNPEGDDPIIAISNGSACTSAKIEPSHVLIALGLNVDYAFWCVRLSLEPTLSESSRALVSSVFSKQLTDISRFTM